MSPEELPTRMKNLTRPEVICVLNGQVGLVGPIVPAGCRKARSQSMQVLEPMSPLGFPFVDMTPIQSKGYSNLTLNRLRERIGNQRYNPGSARGLTL